MASGDDTESDAPSLTRAGGGMPSGCGRGSASPWQSHRRATRPSPPPPPWGTMAKVTVPSNTRRRREQGARSTERDTHTAKGMHCTREKKHEIVCCDLCSGPLRDRHGASPFLAETLDFEEFLWPAVCLRDISCAVQLPAGNTSLKTPKPHVAALRAVTTSISGGGGGAWGRGSSTAPLSSTLLNVGLHASAWRQPVRVPLSCARQTCHWRPARPAGLVRKHPCTMRHRVMPAALKTRTR